MPHISIIVPAYNCEATIQRCLDSICAQTVRDLEILVVSDGSTDLTLQIVKEYAKKDNRIIYLEQENQGQGYARNLGIENAKGEYFGFVDADDTIAENMYELLLSAIETAHADIAQCNLSLKSPDGKVLLNRMSHNRHKIEEIQENRGLYIGEYVSGAIHSYECCNKLVKRSLIMNHSILFESNSKVFAEDLLFNLDLTLYAQRIVFVDGCLYHYYRYPHSHSSQTHYDNIEQLYQLFEIYIRHGEKTGEFDDLKSAIYKTALLVIMNHASQTLKYNHLKVKIKEILLRKDIQNYLSYLRKHGKDLKVRLLVLVLMYFPYKLKCLYLKFYFRVK